MRFESENLWMSPFASLLATFFSTRLLNWQTFACPWLLPLFSHPIIGTWLNALRKGALCYLFLNSAFKFANFRLPVDLPLFSHPLIGTWLNGFRSDNQVNMLIFTRQPVHGTNCADGHSAEPRKIARIIWKVKANPTLSYAACPFPPPLWSFSTIRLAYVRSVKANCATKGRSITARLQNRSSSTVRDVPAIIDDEDDQLRGAITNPVPSTSRAHAQIDCNAGLMRISNRLDRLSETVEALRIYQFSLLTTQKLNEWDITHCHSAIFLHDELIAEHSAQQNDFGIGLAPHWMGMHEIVGHTEHSFAYWSDGSIHGCCDSLPNPLDGFTQFGEADTVGCGIDLLTRAIFFTMNGTRIETGYLYADTVHMFACCTLVDYEDRIQANFGPHFMYNLSSLVPF
ncbi:hypothetical protein niasHT_003717 [Heterodera trifolii]|uniref:SPRY domain-containing protein n=1 Tax=Heterodera trifolii TaxID=157864 RepID=A0ABD2M917_9BILA